MFSLVYIKDLYFSDFQDCFDLLKGRNRLFSDFVSLGNIVRVLVKVSLCLLKICILKTEFSKLEPSSRLSRPIDHGNIN